MGISAGWHSRRWVRAKRSRVVWRFLANPLRRARRLLAQPGKSWIPMVTHGWAVGARARRRAVRRPACPATACTASDPSSRRPHGSGQAEVIAQAPEEGRGAGQDCLQPTWDHDSVSHATFLRAVHPICEGLHDARRCEHTAKNRDLLVPGDLVRSGIRRETCGSYKGGRDASRSRLGDSEFLTCRKI